MPLYFFRISNGSYSGSSDQGTECADRDAAWKELTKVSADIASGIARKLQPNSEWHMEMLDEARQPVFRIRIVSESFEQIAGASALFPKFVVQELQIGGISDQSALGRRRIVNSMSPFGSSRQLSTALI